MASAQEIEPNEFVPAPAGVNAVLGYYLYQDKGNFELNGGGTVKNSGAQVNVGIARLVHYTSLFGQPAGYQILEAFGSVSAPHLGGANLGSAFGASKPLLSAFFWPYASTEKKEYFIIAGFVQPPIGTYDKNATVNVAGAFDGVVEQANEWSGDVQFGWDQGIGEHFSYDASLDIRAFGEGTAPGNRRFSTDTEFRLQYFANWAWTRAFSTSIGYEGFFGGTNYTNGISDGTSAGGGKAQSIRAVASMFVAPNAQVLLEVNHTFSAMGGFEQPIGVTARVLYVF